MRATSFHPPMPARRTLSVRGCPVDLHVYGEIRADTPLFFAIHGAGDAAFLWREVATRLAGPGPSGGFCVAAIDLPGHGGSPGPALDSVAAIADFASAVLAAARFPRVVLVGHSMGGAVAIELALLGRTPLAGLALVATGARLRTSPAIFEAVRTDWPMSCRHGLAFAFGPSASDTVKEAYFLERVAGSQTSALADYRACDGFNRLAEVRTLSLPTLIVGATHDQLTPAKFSQFLADNIAGSTLVICDDVGHEIPLEAPDQLARALAAKFRAPA